MRILLGCVNSAVSLVGYDLGRRESFWFCPANVHRVCGTCLEKDALWTASDDAVTRISRDGIRTLPLPGPHENLAHSVKFLEGGMLAVADTGNSRVLLRTDLEDFASLSPVAGWGPDIPADAIHLNDFMEWEGGLLVSAFAHQPFRQRGGGTEWKRQGLGCIFHVRAEGGRTVSRIVAAGINCPHSLAIHEGSVFCCASSDGALLQFDPDGEGGLRLVRRRQVTSGHFLRGIMRLEDGWLLGGSSRRRDLGGEGMALLRIGDGDGPPETLRVANAGEIYDIAPWDAELMRGVVRTLHGLPTLDVEGTFPPRCVLPPGY
ncbi:MAG: hypothetical protein LBR22_09260 [Desulfovibrio sp.]|jgi:hypothetical protein|nr:hypothetical protein [Desulfovibrio sp.]